MEPITAPANTVVLLAASAAAVAAVFAAMPSPAAPPPSAAELPFSFDSAPGRLPKNVVPQSYRIAIAPDIAAMTLSGTESVSLLFRSATDTIEFNTLNQRLDNVRLDNVPVASVESNDAQQLSTVMLAKLASVGLHTLTFTYRGKIETGPQGLFAQHYAYPDGASGVMLSTKMEATDARRMLPCWDEPAFRASFELTLTIPTAWVGISNMPIASRTVERELATVTFRPSPKMPSYLIEFSAGELAALEDHSGATTLGLWAVRGQQQQGATALINARQILADYNAYFGYAYPLPKLDSIAIPGGFDGAMENWGAITYSELLLLLPPSSDIAQRQKLFSVQAHEMAHQWNGDLVTMGWWDELWLNESFASWMAAKETAQRNPSWHWWENQDEDKERAMSADALTDSHPIQQHVTDELQASNAFDPIITYRKGQAFLRMLEAYLGPGVFRDGVRRYIKARAFSNATTADLWNGLDQASRRDVGEIAAAWTRQPGFPLVKVSASCTDGRRTLRLSQTRFLLQGTDANPPHWSIPLQVRAGIDSTPQTVLLRQDGQRIAAGRCDEPLSVNADAVGFYRAEYDETTFRTNVQHFARLLDGDRIALLDDQWALVEARMQPLASYFALVSSMGDGLDTRAWQQIASALGEIEYDERGKAGHDAFAAYARSILKPAFDRVGWVASPQETPDRSNLRRTLINDLSSWGDQAVIDEARRRYEQFILDRNAIAPQDQMAILSAVARNADAATFEQLHALAKSAQSIPELQRYFGALMAVRDPELAARSAQIITSDEIPMQANTVRFALVTTFAQAQPQLAWSTFTAHADMLLSSFGHVRPLVLAQVVPRTFWNSLPPERLEAWIRAQLPAEMAPVIERGTATVRLKLAEKAALVPAADDFLRGS
jgi:aminopeptidase N